MVLCAKLKQFWYCAPACGTVAHAFLALCAKASLVLCANDSLRRSYGLEVYGVWLGMVSEEEHGKAEQVSKEGM